MSSVHYRMAPVDVEAVGRGTDPQVPSRGRAMGPSGNRGPWFVRLLLLRSAGTPPGSMLLGSGR